MNFYKPLLISMSLLYLAVTPAYAQTISGTNSGLFDSLTSLTSQLITFNNPVELVDPSRGFEAGDKPSFVLEIPQKNQEAIGEVKEENWQVKDEKISATFTYQDSDETIPAVIQKDSQGQFSVSLPVNNPDLELQRGNYTLEVSARESFIYERNLTQDFSWGVLAVNTNKSIYTQGEEAKLAFGVVDEKGHTICNAKLTLIVADPQKNKSTLSTDAGTIQKSDECRGDTVTTRPDYSALYQTKTAGRYFMHLTAETHNGTFSITDYFEVKDSVAFDVERTVFPTRIYPRAPYEVKLTIKPNEDYSGIVSDFVPKSFRIAGISDNGSLQDQSLAVSERLILTEGSTLNESPKIDPAILEKFVETSTQIDKTPTAINWQVNWQKGQTYTLSYTIFFPLISPEFYLLGPLTIGNNPVILGSEATPESNKDYSGQARMTNNQNVVFQEVRQWQIASDAVVCWDGGGADENWTTVGNWASDTAPTTTDTATFGSPTCTLGSPNKNVTINSGFVNPSGTGGGIDIESGYTGTMTQATGVTITLGTIGYTQDCTSCTFTGGNSAIAINSGGDFNLSAGTFTSTSGTLTTQDDWTISGSPTFNTNSGTITFEADADNTATVTGSATFNNLTFNDSGGVRTFTVASVTTLTVSGTLTFTGTSFCTVNGPGAISAQGAITATGGGCGWGSVVVTINGTGDQTVTGEGDTDTAVPSIIINKSAGTLSFVSGISPSNDWTYSRGTLSMGSSTIAFNSFADNSATITGSMTFNNLSFIDDGANSVNTFTIASGTTLTASGTLTLTDDNSFERCEVNGPGAISAQGAITATVEGCNGNVVISINGTGDQTFTGEADTNTRVPGININKPSGTLSFVNTIQPTDNWTYTTGTLSMGSSTVIFEARDNSATIAGSMTFNNLSFNEDTQGSSNTFTITAGTTLTASGTLTLIDEGGTEECIINGPGDIIAQGAISNTLGGCRGSAAITLTGTASQTITSSGTSFLTGTFTVNKSSGVATLAANFSVNTAGQDLYIRSGTLSLASFNLTVNDVFNIEASGTLRLRGAETVSTIDSNLGTLEFTGDGDGVADNPYSTITTYGTTMQNLTINSTDTGANRDVFVLGAALDVNGNVTITAGNLDVSATSWGLTVGGNFANSDVFTQRSGTVTFDTAGNSSTISGSTTFNNFTCTTAGKGLFFTAGTTQTISGTFTITGSAGSLVGLVSTSASVATINASGTASVSYAAIKYITATTAFTASTSYNNGNNTSITFTDEAGAGTPVTRIKGGTTINGGTRITN